MQRKKFACRHTWAAVSIHKKNEILKNRLLWVAKNLHRLISKSVFNTCILCPDSSLYLVLFYYYIPDRFLRPFKNDGQGFILFCKNISCVSAHTCPFRRLTPPLSPTSGDSSRLIFFQFLLTFTASLCSSKSGSLASHVRGRLTFTILFFCGNFHSILLAKCNPPLPSFLSGGKHT